MAKRTTSDDAAASRPRAARGSRSAELAIGTVVNRTDYSSPTWEKSPHWEEGVPTDPKEKIRKAMRYYSKDSLVNKAVSLLSQLANDSFRINCDDVQTELFANSWWRDIGGPDFQVYFFREYFRSGNIPVFKTLVPYVPKRRQGGVSRLSEKLATRSMEAQKAYDAAFEQYINTRDGSKARAAAERTLVKAAQEWAARSIPGSYTVLNPLAVDLAGPEQLPWFRTISLKLNDEAKKAITEPTREVRDIVKLLPRELVTQVKSGKDTVLLPPHLCALVTRDKQPYETWAEPLCTHAFDALDFKAELREMDRATVRGVRNRILKVTIGSDKFPCLDDKALKKLAAEFNNPSRNLTIFWNHTLAMEFIEPKLESLNIDKYKPVNGEIRECFGISEVLTGGGGEAAGNNVLNMKSLLEVVVEAQTAFISWFHQEMLAMAQSLNMSTVPLGGFGKLNLKDENEFTRVVMQMVDRQLVSYQTAMDTLGYYFPKEVARLEGEQKIRAEKGILVPQKAPTQGGGGGGGGPSGQEGRPPDVSEPDGQRRKSQNKPKSPSQTKTLGTAETKDEMLKLALSIYDAELAKVKDEGKSVTDRRKASAIRAATLGVVRHAMEAYHLSEATEEAALLRVVRGAEVLGEFYPERQPVELLVASVASLIVELR